MYEIEFYEDKNGKSEVVDLIKGLHAKAATSKECRINFNKIVAYIDMLEELGTRVGEPVTKHLDGEIWELRPLRDRIFFVGWYNNSFILLHHYMKKTQKTPAREIHKAKKELADLKERESKL